MHPKCLPDLPCPRGISVGVFPFKSMAGDEAFLCRSAVNSTKRTVKPYSMQSALGLNVVRDDPMHPKCLPDLPCPRGISVGVSPFESMAGDKAFLRRWAVNTIKERLCCTVLCRVPWSLMSSGLTQCIRNVCLTCPALAGYPLVSPPSKEWLVTKHFYQAGQ